MNEKVLIGFNRHYYPKLINLQQPIFIKLISCCQWCLESLFKTYRNCPPRQNNYFVKKVPRPDVVFLWCLLTWQSQKPHTRLVLSCDVQQFCRHSGASLHFSFSSLQENRWVLAIVWLNWVCVDLHLKILLQNRMHQGFGELSTPFKRIYMHTKEF